jgi:hypothetical protein
LFSRTFGRTRLLGGVVPIASFGRLAFRTTATTAIATTAEPAAAHHPAHAHGLATLLADLADHRADDFPLVLGHFQVFAHPLLHASPELLAVEAATAATAATATSLPIRRRGTALGQGHAAETNHESQTQNHRFPNHLRVHHRIAPC